MDVYCICQVVYEQRIEKYKKEAKKWEDKLRRNEEHLKKLESEKKREQHEGELGVVLWAGVNHTC